MPTSSNRIPLGKRTRRFAEDAEGGEHEDATPRQAEGRRGYGRYHSRSRSRHNGGRSRSRSPPVRSIRDRFSFEKPPPIRPHMSVRVRNARTVVLTNIGGNAGARDIKTFFEGYNDLLELKHDVTTKATGAKDDAPAKQGSDDPSLAKLTGLRPLEVYDISILLHPRLQKTRMPGQRYATYVNRRYSKCIAYVEFHSISMAQMACQQYNGRHFIYE